MRARNRRVQVASSDTAQSLNVVAPSLVNTQSKAANNAAALSQALGFAGNVANVVTQRNQQADRDAGTLAAQEGLTEKELAAMKKSAAFVLGAEQTIAKQRIIQDTAAATEFYQTQFDKNKSVGELGEALSDFWKDRYENISPTLAREIAPLMAQASERIKASHAAFQGQQTQIQLRDANADILTDALANGFSPAIWQELRTKGSAQLGKSTFNAIAVETIDRFARENLDPTVWDRPEFKMLRENRLFKDIIAKSKTDAETGRIAKAEQDSFAQQGIDNARLGSLADAGDPLFLELLESFTQPDANGATRLPTTAAVQGMMARFLKGSSQGSVDAVNDNIWRIGDGQSLKPEERDRHATREAARVGREALAKGATEEEAQDLALDALINRSVVNNHLPASLKEQFESNPRNKEKFLNSVRIYDQFEAEDPGFIAENTDPDVIRDILRFKQLRLETGDDDAALATITDNDPTLWKGVSEAARLNAVDAVVERLQDGPLFFGTGIDNTDRLRGMIKADLENTVGQGVPIEQAVAVVGANLDPKNKRFVAVDGELYQSGEGWELSPGGPSEVVQFAKEQFSQDEDIKTLLGNLDLDDMILLPVPNRPGFVRVTLNGPLSNLAKTPPIAIQQLNENYQGELDRLAVEAEVAATEKAITRAKDRLLTIPPGGRAPASFIAELRAQRDRKWNAFTPEQRRDHIEQARQ